MVFALLIQGKPHDVAKVLPAVNLIGGHVHLDLARGSVVGDLVDVYGGESQQADQQEIANDDKDASVHGVVANERDSLEADSAWASISAASSTLRRAGRRWKILNTETKTTPKAVEE